MKLILLTVGETKTGFFKLAELEYFKRIQHYGRIEKQWVKPEPIRTGLNSGIIKTREGRRLLQAIPKSCHVIALDRSGIQWSSEELAVQLSKWQNLGYQQVALIIGGALGLSDEVLKHSMLRVSLSKMTFPHEMVPMIILEQIYRAYSILRGEQYHK